MVGVNGLALNLDIRGNDVSRFPQRGAVGIL